MNTLKFFRGYLAIVAITFAAMECRAQESMQIGKFTFIPDQNAQKVLNSSRTDKAHMVKAMHDAYRSVERVIGPPAPRRDWTINFQIMLGGEVENEVEHPLKVVNNRPVPTGGITKFRLHTLSSFRLFPHEFVHLFHGAYEPRTAEFSEGLAEVVLCLINTKKRDEGISTGEDNLIRIIRNQESGLLIDGWSYPGWDDDRYINMQILTVHYRVWLETWLEYTDKHPEFIKEFFQAIYKTPFNRLPLTHTELVNIGETVSPGFSSWFEQQITFQVAREGEFVYASLLGDNLFTIAFERRVKTAEVGKIWDINLVPINHIIVTYKDGEIKRYPINVAGRRVAVLEMIPLDEVPQIKRLEVFTHHGGYRSITLP